MSETTPTCRHCGRSDCDLLATVIVGERAMHKAVADCIAVQRANERAEQQAAARRGGR